MVKILVWFILSYGLMNIMVYGSIFAGLRNSLKEWGETKNAPLRPLGEFLSGLISCPMCFSTWGGFFLGFCIYSPVSELFNLTDALSWFFDGILSSGAVWIINSVVEWFEENRMSNQKQELTYIVKDEEGNEIING
jgi:hypothetical protein